MSAANDRKDFARFIRELGLTKAQMANAAAVVEFETATSLLVRVGDSEIQGQGVIAKRAILPERRICAALKAGTWNTFGRYANHSATPNAEPRISGDQLDFFSLQKIQRGAEVTVNYRLIRALIQPVVKGVSP